MRKFLIIMAIFWKSPNCYGQVIDSTKNATHIFWQPDLELTYKDYKGTPMQAIVEDMRKYGYSASASTGIWSILDIPKRKGERTRKFEKVYIAPAFEKTTSFAKTEDTLQIQMQNLYFDICEIWARSARKQLKAWQDSTNATGTLTIVYSTIIEEMQENKKKMFRGYAKEVFVDKQEGAFLKWRKAIDTILEETQKWATTPQDCYRFVTKKPIEKGYIQAPTVFPSMRR
jgi:hypothetical protein